MSQAIICDECGKAQSAERRRYPVQSEENTSLTLGPRHSCIHGFHMRLDLCADCTERLWLAVRSTLHHFTRNMS